MKRIWYESPAENWNEALPIGNGFLGAMVFGGTDREIVQLNEDSLWSGKTMNRNNPGASDRLEEIRNLIFNGEIAKAEKLMRLALSGIPEGQRSYQTLGNLQIDFDHPSLEVTDYDRELSFSDGVAKVSYTAGVTRFTREYFASYPKNIIAVRLSASEKASLSFAVSLKRDRHIDKIEARNNMLIMRGSYGFDFACCAKICISGGSLRVDGQYISVDNADSAVIYITAATIFRHDNPVNACLDKLREKFDYEAVRKEHICDFNELFNRVQLNLGTDGDDVPTDKRLQAFSRGGSDNGLIGLYFDFGRYLLISSSRPGSLPANLQGIWNNEYLPPWDSKYTININAQMNYWPAEICGLHELHMPLFDLIKRMVPNGRETARVMYNCKGFVAHHNTDLWGDTAPQDEWIPATYWVMGAAWLCLHIYEHYLFTLDVDFLKEYYPILREACEFFVDFLVEDNNGKLVTIPSVSPENVYILPSGEQGSVCYAPAMDNQILRGLFDACVQSAGILGIDFDFAELLLEMKQRLYENRIGSQGQLLEWCEEYEEAEPGHRHISHLFDLYPGYGINPEKTPELALAARKTLNLRLSRGGGHTGWSRAWIINLWARLMDGEKANENLRLLLSNSTLPNLFDNHPPFQIDGNFGATAAIAEMLLQSHTDTLHLLPALPHEWKTGSVTGLKARGGLTVDIIWENGEVREAGILSRESCKKAVNTGGRTYEIELTGGIRAVFAP